MAAASPSRRPLGVRVLTVISVLGAIAAVPVALGVFVGLIDTSFVGLGSTGLSAPGAALALLAYTAFALVFAYGIWTLRRWGWWFGIIFFAGSAVEDVVGGIVGWQPPLVSAAFVAVALLLLAYWVRPSVRAAFRN